MLINILFLGAIIFILDLTILPEASLSIGVDQGGINIIPLATIKHVLLHDSIMEIVLNNIGNIILFMPFGFLLPFKFKWINSLPKTCLMGMFLSISIESIQLLLPNRWTDIDDVILNTLGTGIGYSLLRVINKQYKKT
ncbi:VanZ family protein [Priestia aryabhattai]|uniref:VanZ family protein n=1 Tax=Priestia aryabhattai TaxID=412384 RepID=UPI0007ABC249|nr:VanZ family protein [Priestia aryabhattai]KZE14005.1 hypothetical protein AVW12_22050 [Priestia aryabhattai]